MTTGNLVIRPARREEVETIAHLINNGGPLGKPREVLPEPLPASYFETFDRIEKDPSSFLMVAELEGAIVGTFYLFFIHNLMGKGKDDAQLESVHVRQESRGKGIGASMMKWVIEECRKRSCRRIQLTTDKHRKDAHRFYEKVGFTASHEGMKLTL